MFSFCVPTLGPHQYVCIKSIWHWITYNGWYAIKSNQNKPNHIFSPTVFAANWKLHRILGSCFGKITSLDGNLWIQTEVCPCGFGWQEGQPILSPIDGNVYDTEETCHPKEERWRNASRKHEKMAIVN